MANIDDFGIVKSDLMRVLNPSYDLNVIQIGYAANGSDGSGGSGTYTSSGASWLPDQWVDYYLYNGGSYYQVTTNTSSQLTLSGSPDLSGAGADWEIRVKIPDMSDTQFSAVVQEQVSMLKSRIPERYRKMLYEVEGEELVESFPSNAGDTVDYTLSLSNASSVVLYKNYEGKYSEREQKDCALTEGYSVDGQTVTLTSSYFSEGDSIHVDYAHDLSSVPELLKALAIRIIAAEVESAVYRIQSGGIPEMAQYRFDSVDKILAVMNEGMLGVEEFDNIDLYVETR